MMSRVNLVAILFTISCIARASVSAGSAEEETENRGKEYSLGRKMFREIREDIGAENPLVLRDEEAEADENTKIEAEENSLALLQNDVEEREHPRRRKRKMDRTMMALLMAYKMKFIALVPTMLGGLVLLKATALLAGFFFALFAAVLGLKAH